MNADPSGQLPGGALQHKSTIRCRTYSTCYEFHAADYYLRVLQTPRQRLILRVLVVAAFFFFLAAMIAKPIATAYVRSKLQQTLSARLDGELQLGSLSYSFPLGVHVGPSRLISRDPQGGQFEILGMDSFDLVLHRLPFRSGPLIIERVAIGHPVVHVIQTDEGIVGIQAGVRHKATDPNRPERKLSEIFQLRHVKLDGGEVQYEDRRREGAVSLVWRGFNLDFGTEPSSGAKYAFDLSTNAGQFATLTAKGDFDIDTLDVALADSLLNVHVAQNDSESPLPAAFVEQLRKYNVKGDLAIATTANASLRNLKAATFDTKITLKDATAQLPGNGLKLDDASLSFECHRTGDSPLLAIVFSTALRTAGTTFTIEKASASIDPIKQQFALKQSNTTIDLGAGSREGLPASVAQVAGMLKPGGRLVVTLAASGPISAPSLDALTYEFAVTAHDIAIKPPGFPQYLTAVNGSVHTSAGVIAFENLTARYGGDTLHVAGASMPIESFDHFVHIKDIAADVVLRDPHPAYPDVLENIFAVINPRGPIAVAGNVTVDNTSSSSSSSKVDYSLHITSEAASLTPTQYAVPITHLKSDISLAPGRITVTHFDAAAFDGHIAVSGEVLGNSPHDGLTYKFAATARDITIKPPGFPQPLTALSGSVRTRADSIEFENLTAQYGGDSLHVAGARVPIEPFDRYIHVKGIAADVVLRDPHPKYPVVLENIFTALNPRGPIAVAGDVSVDRTTGENKVDYNLHITSSAASLTLSQYAIPVRYLKSDISIAPDKIAVTQFDAAVFDGHLTATGEILGKSPQTYQAQIALRGAELKEIIDTFSPERKSAGKEASGICILSAELSGSSDPPDVDPITTMKGHGDVEVIDGNFLNSPVLSGVASESSVTAEAITVGRAAAFFDIADRKIKLKNAAVSAPVLGIQGSGTVAFDGQLDLRLVAAPLADWRSQIKSTGIPILSEVVGDVVGVAQKAINGATKKILYEFHVTGFASKPKIEAVPAPVLTEGAAKLFVGMVRAGKDLNLMETIRGGARE
jgi:hypothetical protein